MFNGIRLRLNIYLKIGAAVPLGPEALEVGCSDASLWTSLTDSPGVCLGASAFSLLSEYIHDGHRPVLQVWEVSVFFRGHGKALLRSRTDGARSLYEVTPSGRGVTFTLEQVPSCRSATEPQAHPSSGASEKPPNSRAESCVYIQGGRAAPAVISKASYDSPANLGIISRLKDNVKGL